MTIQNEGDVSLLDPFTHTKQDHDKIKSFDFVGGERKEEKEKVTIEETHCMLVTVGGMFFEKNRFKVLKKVEKIRKIIRKYLNILLHLYVKETQICISMYNLQKTLSDELLSDHMNRIPLAVFIIEDDGGRLLDYISIH